MVHSDRLDHRVLQVLRMVLLVHQDRKAYPVHLAKVFRVKAEFKEHKGFRVLLGCLVLRDRWEFREFKAHKDFPVRLDFQAYLD